MSLSAGLSALAAERLSAVVLAGDALAERALAAVPPSHPAKDYLSSPVSARRAAAEARALSVRSATAVDEILSMGLSEQVALLDPLVCALDWLTDASPSLRERVEAVRVSSGEMRRGEVLGALGSASIEAALLAGNAPPQTDLRQVIGALARSRLGLLASEVDRWLEER